jgi:hypothetical protein
VDALITQSCIRGDGAGKAGHLWNSYNFTVALISKIYASGGTSPRANSRGRLSGPVHDGQEQLMLDIVMLALGFGFFVASIGYAYACERL